MSWPAVGGELFHWRATSEGRVAELIILDQFSRNMFRDTPEAFAYDGIALVLAQEAVRVGALDHLGGIPAKPGINALYAQ